MKTRLYEKLTAKLVDRYGSNIHTAFADILDISNEEAVAISKKLRFKQYLNMSNALASGDVNTARALATEAKESYDLIEQRPLGYEGGGSDNLARTGRAPNLGKTAPAGQYPTAATTGKENAKVAGLTSSQKRQQERLQRQAQMAQQQTSMGTAQIPDTPTIKPKAPGQDMEDAEPATLNIRSGQTPGQALTGFKAVVKPGDSQVEFKDSKTGKSFMLPQELFIEEDLECLRRLAGI